MIRKDEFNKILVRLQLTYEKRSIYNTYRANHLFDKIHKRSLNTFAEAVDGLISWRVACPSINDIIKAMNEYEARTGKKEVNKKQEIKEMPWCDKCGKTGMIMAKRHKTDPTTQETVYYSKPYTFACDCPSGQRERFAYPSWENKHHNEYEVQFCKEDRGEFMTYKQFLKKNPDYQQDNFLMKIFAKPETD